MRCDNYKKWINDALDGTLSEKQKLEFEKHLDSCSDCARETEEGYKLKQLLRNVAEAELPSDFKKKLHSRLLLAQQEENEGRKPWIKWTAGLAAVFALVFSIYKFLNIAGVPQRGNEGMYDYQIAVDDSKQDPSPAAGSPDGHDENPEEYFGEANYYTEDAEDNGDISIETEGIDNGLISEGRNAESEVESEVKSADYHLYILHTADTDDIINQITELTDIFSAEVITKQADLVTLKFYREDHTELNTFLVRLSELGRLEPDKPIYGADTINIHIERIGTVEP
ncbi:MAG: zf-HC2 domain-containing protein [Caldicoprobacterales bacterium]|nr:hypothetical protein [Clostridiales bacterium]